MKRILPFSPRDLQEKTAYRTYIFQVRTNHKENHFRNLRTLMKEHEYFVDQHPEINEQGILLQGRPLGDGRLFRSSQTKWKVLVYSAKGHWLPIGEIPPYQRTAAERMRERYSHYTVTPRIYGPITAPHGNCEPLLSNLWISIDVEVHKR